MSFYTAGPHCIWLHYRLCFVSMRLHERLAWNPAFSTLSMEVATQICSSTSSPVNQALWNSADIIGRQPSPDHSHDMRAISSCQMAFWTRANSQTPSPPIANPLHINLPLRSILIFPISAIAVASANAGCIPSIATRNSCKTSPMDAVNLPAEKVINLISPEWPEMDEKDVHFQPGLLDYCWETVVPRRNGRELAIGSPTCQDGMQC
ncbi:hypothetical protein BDQ12DRAFT_722535 [Crucibulum laeve]|uniref:Uncharacterized protein n=1 Tax=Crucibulum laeve TaxID=68775 RepID=A0A5C3M1Y8_9AGAR|nr:hypothetical protein BDQ12DRAFT_722535 [Crucibulum laeve]